MKKYFSYQLSIISKHCSLLTVCCLLLFFACGEKKEPAKDLGIIETHPVHGAVTQASFKVWGNCESCQNNVETAARFKGVTFCAWDTLTKVCTVTYDTRETSVDAIEKAIAAVGYDTEGYRGDDAAYADLAPCCQYERKK
ncbi:MAG: heavy metal-associated domain-containing protein [Bacteroidia bacterium]